MTVPILPAAGRPGAPRSILIIRPSAMGDIVMATPLLRALRNAYPEAHIAWLVEPGLVDLLRHHPELNEVLLWPKGEWQRLARERRYPALLRSIRELRRELRQRHFDLVIDAVGLAKSRFLLWLSGARLRVGFASREPGGFLLDRQIVKQRNDIRMSSEYSDLADALGLAPGRFHPEIVVSAADAARATELRQELGLAPRYAILAPFTTRPQKHWFDACWVEVATLLRQRLHLDLLILGGPADRAHAESIIAASKVPLHHLCGRSSLGQSAALIRDCSLLVGVDTGLTHMGTAFSRPTVALFGATRPYLTTPSDKTRVLYEPFTCSPCRRTPTCGDRFDCMLALTAERVVAVCAELLDEERAGA